MDLKATQTIMKDNEVKTATTTVMQENEFENRCTQLQCTYYIKGGCKPCENCSAGPYQIKKGCAACHHCVHTEGALRFTPGGSNETEN